MLAGPEEVWLSLGLPYRAVDVSWAQPALAHGLCLRGRYTLLKASHTRMKQQPEPGERCPVLEGLSGGPHLGDGVLRDVPGQASLRTTPWAGT